MTTIARRALPGLFALLVLGSAAAAGEPLQVYVLAGQSNMEGHAKVETFDYIGEDPATAPLLAMMRDADGAPVTCDDVWISYLTGRGADNGEGHGRLTTGYGARRTPSENGGKIGPEFTFGLTMAEAVDGPILLIKTAWGGKSLHTDFRPPSAGPYVFRADEIERFEKQGKDVAQIRAEKADATGHYYRLMIGHVRHVLGDVDRVVPGHDAAAGYEIAGFVWFQAWNDMVDRGVYPTREKPGGYDAYSANLAHFIRDVRRDLDAPGMPFVIGVVGVGGPLEHYDNQNHKTVHGNFRAAMAAPASLPEFRGNVRAVPTAPYWDRPLAAIDAKRGQVNQMAHLLRSKNPNHANADGSMTPAEQKAFVEDYRSKVISAEERAMWERGASNAGYHYLGCAKTMALIGQSFAEAVLEMQSAGR